MSSTSKIQAQKGLLEALDAFLALRIDVIEFSQHATSAMHKLGQSNNSLFQYFFTIDLQTDRFPIGPVREHWLPKALEPHDDERKAIENSLREDAILKARVLLEWTESQEF